MYKKFNKVKTNIIFLDANKIIKTNKNINQETLELKKVSIVLSRLILEAYFKKTELKQ